MAQRKRNTAKSAVKVKLVFGFSYNNYSYIVREAKIDNKLVRDYSIVGYQRRWTSNRNNFLRVYKNYLLNQSN